MGSWRLEFTKWDGAPHWHFDLSWLGADEHGQWLGAGPGAQLQRGLEPPIHWDCAFLILAPLAADHVATFNASGKYQLYLDVTGPVTIEVDGRGGGVIRAVDLDLDVVRRATGRVELLDAEEFLEHQQRYGYPVEVIRAAQATSDRLLSQVRAEVEPFAAAAEPWFRVLAQRLDA
jgi:hypothetical protein